MDMTDSHPNWKEAKFWGEYLYLRENKEEKNAENCILGIPLIYTLCQVDYYKCG